MMLNLQLFRTFLICKRKINSSFLILRYRLMLHKFLDDKYILRYSFYFHLFWIHFIPFIYTYSFFFLLFLVSLTDSVNINFNKNGFYVSWSTKHNFLPFLPLFMRNVCGFRYYFSSFWCFFLSFLFFQR